MEREALLLAVKVEPKVETEDKADIPVPLAQPPPQSLHASNVAMAPSRPKLPPKPAAKRPMAKTVCAVQSTLTSSLSMINQPWTINVFSYLFVAMSHTTFQKPIASFPDS